jgi:hypothetical protein
VRACLAARPPPFLGGEEERERSGESPWDGARGREEGGWTRGFLEPSTTSLEREKGGEEERERRAVSAEPIQFWEAERRLAGLLIFGGSSS